MIKHDYKPQNSKDLFKKSASFSSYRWLTHPYIIVSSAFICTALAFLLLLSSDQQTSLQLGETVNSLDTPLQTSPQLLPQSPQYSQPVAIPLELESSSEAVLPEAYIGDNWKAEVIKKGDSLSTIFERIGLSPQQLHQVVNLDENTKILSKIRPGEMISYQIENDQLLALRYDIDIQNTLHVENFQGALSSRIDNKKIEYRTAFVSATINGSLFLAGKKAGMTDSQIMQLAGIFDWDIDFVLDIRKGDSFSMLYEEQFIEGEKIADGQIIATEFINQGKVYTAVRYVDINGEVSYFTPEGLSMRKAFLRAPVNFKYISSGFNPVRFHPVLKKIRPHRGIDYVAPVGTPIRASGDGKVVTSGYNKYNGKYVVIQHGNNIMTKYLHLSTRMVSRGKRVKQGDIIGKLGATGMVTGAHLHYEFLVNGVHRNPRTVKLPDAEPIAKSELERFKQQTAPLLKQLFSHNTVVNQPTLSKP